MACPMCLPHPVITTTPGASERYGRTQRSTKPFVQRCIVCRVPSPAAVAGATPGWLAAALEAGRGTAVAVR